MPFGPVHLEKVIEELFARPKAGPITAVALGNASSEGARMILDFVQTWPHWDGDVPPIHQSYSIVLRHVPEPSDSLHEVAELSENIKTYVKIIRTFLNSTAPDVFCEETFREGYGLDFTKLPPSWNEPLNEWAPVHHALYQRYHVGDIEIRFYIGSRFPSNPHKE